MPRSSRHRSHRSHKHGLVEYSGSDDGGVSKERKLKDEDLPVGTGARASRDLEYEKRKTSHSSQGKESHGASNGYASGEHVKKRKERTEETIVSDRWKSGSYDDLMGDTRFPEQIFGPIDVDKSSKPKHSEDDSKSRSSRRQEGHNQRNEESGGKVESGKQRSDKDSGWRETGDRDKEERAELSRRDSGDRYKERAELSKRESGDQCREERERERGRKERERGLDKDKNAQDAKHHPSEDTFSRKNTAKAGRKGHAPRKDVEISENHMKEEPCIPVMEKDFEKHIRRRNDFEGEDDDRKHYYGDDDGKSRSSKDHRPEAQKYKDKYRNNADRDRRHRDERRQDDRFSGYHTSDRYDSRNSKDEIKSSENHYKKSRLHDKDDYGNLYDDYGAKDRDPRVRKRFSEDNKDRGDLKLRNVKEQPQGMENASSSRLDSHIERPTAEHRRSDRGDSSPRKKHTKSSPSSSFYQGKDQSRHRSKLTDSASKEPPFEERIRPGTSSAGEHTPASRHHKRTIESRPLDKFQFKGDVPLHEHTAEVTAASQYDSTLKLDKQSSSNLADDKSPSRSDQQFTVRPSPNHSLETKGQKSSNSKYNDRLRSEMPILDYQSQSKVGNREQTPVGSSSINRISNFSGSSPNHPQHPSRLRSNEPSLFGLYVDDNRNQIGDRKNQNSLPKRSSLSAGRGHGNAWNNAPVWPPPVANGFLPLQHGFPSGFHPAVQQFPGPPLYGIRPSMNLSNAGIPYHMHDAVDRFSGHVRAYGWPNPVDEPCPPHLQLWDGSNGVYGSESSLYGRPIAGNRGWETNADMWKAQDNAINMKFPVPKKELELEKPAVGQPGHQSQLELHGSECLPANHVEANNNTSRVKSVLKSPSKVQHEKKATESSKVSSDGNASYCGNYLPKINISSNLAGSELYVRCTAILESLSINGECVLPDGCSQDIKKESGAKTPGTSNTLLRLLFSSKGHSVFQRAMSLYKKHTDAPKAPLPATPVCSEGNNNIPEVHNEEKGASDLDSLSTSLARTDPNNTGDPSGVGLQNMPSAGSSRPSPVLADDADDMAQERNLTASTSGDHGVYADGKQSQSDLVCDGDVINNVSRDCEAIMAEAVNSSPIPNSLESTH